MDKKWIDHKGQEVPARHVRPIDKRKDAFANKMLKKANKIAEMLGDFKDELYEGGDAIWADMQKAEDVRTGEKGYSISTFDKSIKIEVTQQERIEFDDNIKLAKAKIFEYFDSKLGKDESEIRSIIHNAFETSRGKLDVKRVMGLFKLDIKHPRWTEGMELLKKSIDRNNSSRYVRILARDQEGKYKQIPLSISQL